MANSISNVYIEGFDRNVRQLAQQAQTRLIPYVGIRQSSAEFENWETLGPTEFAEKASRGAITPQANVPWARRVSGNKVYDQGETIAMEDITQMLADPNSNIARSFSMGAARSQDQRIIDAATSTALDGEGVANAFPDGQKVTGDDTPDSYSADISFDLVTKVVEKFLDNNIDPGTRKVAVVSPAQMRKLLQTTEATNQDYAQKALMNGFVNDWMGLDWIVSTLLNSPGANKRDCFVMTDRAIGFQMNKDINTQIDKDPSKSFDWSLYTCWQGGAVRVEDEQIVWMQVSE
jgi:hypothetical protein